jgi:arabinofuranosyltransferase
MLTWAAALLLVIIVARAAWMCDDAYITLRTVDNFWHGYGLRWNVIERVQAYTHPLWMMAIATCYGVTREPYFTTLALSGLCLLGTIALVIRRLAPPQALLALTALMTSRAFVDFSTSGLENPLAHLLLAAFCLRLLDDDASGPARGQSPGVARYRTLAWLAAGCVLTRMDLGLLVGPALIVETWRLGARRALPQAALAALPVIGWHAFTLVYYGSLVPNTALAKLPPGVSKQALIEQGLWYLRDSWRADFVTLPLVCAALGLIAWRGRARRAWPLAAGLIASLVYVVVVGGDFMSGRFVTAIGLCAVIIVAHRLRDPRAAFAAAAALLVIGVVTPRPTLFVWQPDAAYAWVQAMTDSDQHGIVDERRIYSPQTGLVRTLFAGARVTDHPWAKWGQSLSLFPNVNVMSTIGFTGYYAGPALHAIDVMGLSEPFLARLAPTVTFTPGRFRPGHFWRDLPPGYGDSVVACFNYLTPHASVAAVTLAERSCVDAGESLNLVKDARLRALLTDVTLVTQGRLFDGRRWQAIWRLLRTRSN